MQKEKVRGTEDDLGLLHKMVAANLRKRLELGEEVYDSKSGDWIKYDEATPQTIALVIRFLKDNDITCIATTANEMGALQAKFSTLNAGKKRFGSGERDGNKVIEIGVMKSGT